MGQKIIPTSFRLHKIKQWNSNWIVDTYDYSKFLHFDLHFRKYLTTLLNRKKIIFSDIKIKKKNDLIYIFIYVLNSPLYKIVKKKYRRRKFLINNKLNYLNNKQKITSLFLKSFRGYKTRFEKLRLEQIYGNFNQIKLEKKRQKYYYFKLREISKNCKNYLDNVGLIKNTIKIKLVELSLVSPDNIGKRRSSLKINKKYHIFRKRGLRGFLPTLIYAVKFKQITLLTNYLVKVLSFDRKHKQLLKTTHQILSFLFKKIPLWKGYRIQFKGRLNGHKRFNKKTIQRGKIPLSSTNANILYDYKSAMTVYGIISIKIWFYFLKI